MDEILALLAEAESRYHAAYPDSQRAQHFDAHMATVRMVVELSDSEESKKEEAV